MTFSAQTAILLVLIGFGVGVFGTVVGAGGIVFALATIPGAVGGALLVGVVSRRVFDTTMGVVLAALAV